MSALQEIDVSSLAAAAKAENATAIPPEVVAAIKDEINVLFWRWYSKHQGDKVAHVHIWFFGRDIHVADLYNLFELLFGAAPAAPGANDAATNTPNA